MCLHYKKDEFLGIKLRKSTYVIRLQNYNKMAKMLLFVNIFLKKNKLLDLQLAKLYQYEDNVKCI